LWIDFQNYGYILCLGFGYMLITRKSKLYLKLNFASLVFQHSAILYKQWQITVNIRAVDALIF